MKYKTSIRIVAVLTWAAVNSGCYAASTPINTNIPRVKEHKIIPSKKTFEKKKPKLVSPTEWVDGDPMPLGWETETCPSDMMPAEPGTCRLRGEFDNGLRYGLTIMPSPEVPSTEEDIVKQAFPGNKTRVTEPYEEYEEDYYDGTFYEYPCRDRSPRVPCFETLD